MANQKLHDAVAKLKADDDAKTKQIADLTASIAPKDQQISDLTASVATLTQAASANDADDNALADSIA